MKKIFFTGIIGLLLFEVLNVYLIMPMPGSQQMDSIDVAYFLYRWRWAFRMLFGVMIVVGLLTSRFKKKWVPLVPLALVAAIVYMANFYMAAGHMFYKPKQVLMANAALNKTDTGGLVIGIVNNGEAKAYPIRLLGYHHQVYDSIGGKPVIVTYFTVCRTGRVYEPIVNGKQERFRLVGMDHFNAMFEDTTTKSWWRQATGQAITGQLKGQQLPEFFSTQTSLAKWLQLNPSSLVMQADPAFKDDYDTTYKFENGKSKSKLTGTDSLSGKNKSWVIGVKAGNERKAYDWNTLKEKRLIQDKLGNMPVLLVLASDDKSFFAFESPDETTVFSLQNDTIINNGHHYTINGKSIGIGSSLKALPAYQEFLHSWRTFNTGTAMY
ncbi:MAG: DUF3179 domain-containing protein [Ferruginibacter sp.]|nr:DUF3179 domain-containing protein [Ferruginibacter sp.]